MFGISVIDLLVIAFYAFIVIWLGWKAKKKVSSSGDYFMGGRRGSKIMQIANALGAGTHTAQAIAVSGATYQIGLAGIWYQWLYLFSTPIYWLLAPIYRRLRYITIGDFFQERYGLKLASAYSVMGLIYFIGEVGLILKATGVSLEAITGGAVSAEVIVVVLTIFFLSYSVIGGLTSALIINLLQGVLIVMLSFLIIPFALYAGGGISAIKAKIPEHMFSFVAPEEVTLFFIIMLIVNGLVGVSVLPHHMAINGSGKSEMNCRTGWTYGNFTKRFATLGWAFVGVFAAALFPGLASDKREFAFGIAITNLLPVGLIGVMISAMIATVLAACHNYMVGGSALFTRNFYKRFTHHDSTEKEKLKVARISSLVVVIGGVTVALTIPTVVDGLKYIWQITAFFGIAFWVGVMWRRANRYGVWASLITTITLSLYTGKYTPWSLGLPFEYQIAIYLPAGFISLIVVSLLTKPEPESQLNKFFALLHTPVGEENKLKEKGYEIMLEGESVAHKSAVEGTSLEENGHSLLLVDLLSLKSKFSLKRYKVDLFGFGLAILFVIAILLFGIFVSSIG
ncbi:MAG: sodium:solute symporter family protein [Ignavibacteria bacterium]|nr:sodium:solute symporter family protein [Ignavibacteria bacterium]